jgi:hypothetical protein
MFMDANSFNQNLVAWNVANVIDYDNIFNNCPISEANKPQKFRVNGGSAKKSRRASRRASRKRSRKGRRTFKRGTRRTRRR